MKRITFPLLLRRPSPYFKNLVLCLLVAIKSRASAKPTKIRVYETMQVHESLQTIWVRVPSTYSTVNPTPNPLAMTQAAEKPPTLCKRFGSSWSAEILPNITVDQDEPKSPKG
ncbi:hypothetical protein BPAE_0133g00280 [Botrytis paeoniae]|uniref:Uncharacterized protein n=1 Tax=Botrytis paeoniae TaxID=278948 RepID=A0A4Z1FK54_9HELO|nr:hypothetical protein BPAE_0133g00280 [Botrytis paeoniae]